MPTNKPAEKLKNFILTFGATRKLLQRAHKQGFLIEGLVLYSSLIDGFFRICLVLKDQIEQKSNKINEKYIHQQDGRSFFTERQIFKKAFDKKIIRKELFDEINNLYDIRNKFIHRFFISEIEYSHLEIVCNRYEQVFNQLYRITYNLESEQLKKSIGMTIKGKKNTNKEECEINIGIAKKIKSGSEKNLARTLNCVSVEEIIEFATKNGLLKKCICGHKRIEHIDLNILKKKKPKKLEDALKNCLIKSCHCQEYSKDKRKKIRFNKLPTSLGSIPK